MSKRTCVVVAQLGIFAAANMLCAAEVAHHGAMVNGDGRYRECLECHDDVAAKGIWPCLGPVCMLKMDHPVDRPYPPIGKAQEYNPAAVAEMAGVKLLDGRIDCISCHDLNKPTRFHLRIEDVRSRLCLACHIK